MYVWADHAEYTAEQLTEHEVGHDRVAKGEINVQDVRDELATRYAPEDMDRIAESYAMAVDGTDMTAEEIREEIICDSLAGINVFSGTSMEDSFMNTLVDTWDAVQKVEKKDTRGPPAGNTVKASRESKEDSNGRDKAGRKAPAFSVKGQIYFGETLDQKKAGKYAPHEVTHVMKQVGFKPNLDFNERTPGMLNMSSPTTQAILQQVGSHRKVDIATMTADQARDLFDEFNATVYNTLIKK